ncbi:TonB-linked outer membrane protein, SusC/RagA family [Filimonas lacunae]|uniref:TonB-linked outer membrane protein, SusC/RagA family n=1 Tax=Filimonas lacunae TaxID=477680 RepID=A0A173MQ72_9BACT|nr:TonB-dependent receptor [Filimonas lacunae]BAV09488.1 TonB-dependent receptor [Filimonas lacunae]SIS74070.1 TonB-linked outer membrane protein, SusC/RagA family [Filimonas lacunae]
MRKEIRCKLLTLFLCVTCVVQASYAQEKIITGTVKDEKGTPLPTATINVPGRKSVISDENGIFRIAVPDTSKVLIVTYVGLKPVEVQIKGQSVLSIVLTGAEVKLEDVVVIGYGTAKRTNVTSSISSVSEKDIKNLPVAGVDQAIQGKVAGVTVSSNSGQPGGGVSVRVRGITSVNGNDPLYVIDGVNFIGGTSSSTAQDVLGGSAGQTGQSVLATLNPADIEKIDILKDASAQAIYGSLGANGVVQITTKKGKAGESKVAFNSYYGTADLPKKLPVMNLRQYAMYQNSLVPELRAAGETLADTAAEFKNVNVLGNGTDWQDAIFQRGITQNHQLAISGGQNKTTYYFSGNYFEQTGILIGTDFKRYALRMSVDQQVKSWLKAGISANLSRSNQRVGLSDAFDAVTSVVLYNSPASVILSPDGQWAGQVRVAGNPIGTDNNPVAMALLRNVRQIETKAFGALYADMNIMKGLTFRTEVDYNFSLAEGKAFQPLLYNIQKQNDGSYDSTRIIGPSKLSENRNNSLYWTLKTYFNYNNGFGKHWISATLGHEAQSSHYNYIGAYRQNLQQNLPSLAVGAQGNNSGESISAGEGDWRMESYFARASYTYDNRYSVSATIRRDGSSAFGPENRIGYFPSVSAAWTVTNESFANDIKGLNSLKIRAGYGVVGNQNVAANQYQTNIDLSRTSPFGAAGFPRNIGNPKLGWESVKTYNAGVDASLFNKKLDVTVDVYKKITTKMLLATQLADFSGLGEQTNSDNWDDIWTPLANSGKMTNTGIDVAFTTYNITNKDFNWKTTLTFSHYKNILNELNTKDAKLSGLLRVDYSGKDPVITVSQQNRPVGEFYGYVTDGLFKSDAELNNGMNWGLAIGPQQLWLGDQRYKDLDGDKAITDKDVQPIGNPNPKFTGGLNNTFQYKQFDLSVFLYGSYGAKIYNATRMVTERLSNEWNNQLTTVFDRYTPANTSSNMPRFNKWNNYNVRVSDRYIENGSYLRIQTVAFGYNLPADLLKKAKISSARLYVSAQNLYTFTGYSGYNPDMGSFNGNVLLTNIDQGRYPVPRTVTIGANIEF